MREEEWTLQNCRLRNSDGYISPLERGVLIAQNLGLMSVKDVAQGFYGVSMLDTIPTDVLSARFQSPIYIHPRNEHTDSQV